MSRVYLRSFAPPHVARYACVVLDEWEFEYGNGSRISFDYSPVPVSQPELPIPI